MRSIEKVGAWFVTFALAAMAAVAAPRQAAKPAKPAGVRVEAVHAEQLQKVVEAARGKVTVINFWATWCDSCVKEFPDVVNLYKKHHAEGVKLLFVSVDSLSDRDKKVVPFLKTHGVDFTSYIVNQSVDTFVDAVDKSWEGACPRTYILDREGNIRKVITGAIRPAEVDTLLRKLIAERPGSPTTVTARAHAGGFLAQE